MIYIFLFSYIIFSFTFFYSIYYFINSKIFLNTLGKKEINSKNNISNKL